MKLEDKNTLEKYIYYKHFCQSSQMITNKIHKYRYIKYEICH